jgi:uncharacterized membrane protein YeiH
MRKTIPLSPTRMLYLVDLAGTLLFAIEGATTAVANHLDLLGILILGFATAVGGGIIRDVLLGATPPSALRNWHYPAVAFTGAAVAFLFHRYVQEIPPQLLMCLDAAGLSLFAVSGTEEALLRKMSPLVAVMLGGITGVGGGTIRDLLLAHTPRVLQTDIYATAALAGSATMILCRRLGIKDTYSALIGGVVCFLLRIISVWRHWQLPAGL